MRERVKRLGEVLVVVAIIALLLGGLWLSNQVIAPFTDGPAVGMFFLRVLAISPMQSEWQLKEERLRNKHSRLWSTSE
jgi:hypothetical protein